MIPKKFVTNTLNRHYKSFGCSIGFKQFSADSPEPNIYGERIGTKVFGTPITVKGYLEMKPTELTLQELGWSKEDVEIIFRVPFIILSETGLADWDTGSLKLTMDDRMEIKGKDYHVTKMNVREPFIDNRPNTVWIGGRLVKNDYTV